MSLRQRNFFHTLYSKDHYWLQSSGRHFDSLLCCTIPFPFIQPTSPNSFSILTSYHVGVVKDNVVSVRVGVTPSFIEETLGNHDIESIEILADATERTEMLKGNLLSTNEHKPLINIVWSGYKISDGDELYHTVWDNVEGNTHVKRPSEVPTGAKFEIDAFNFERIGRAGLRILSSQSDYWLYTAQMHPETLECFLSEERYNDLCTVSDDVNIDSNNIETTNNMEKLKQELQKRSKARNIDGHA